MPPKRSLRFDLAGTSIEFSCADARWLAMLGERYAGFETREQPLIRVRYHVVESTLPLPDRPYGELAPTRSPELGRLDLSGPGFTITANFSAGTMTLTGPRHTYPVDAAMRELLPLLAREGVVLHTALVTDGRLAWACTGPSGSGKTTLAALLGQRALCDEMALVNVGPQAIEARSLPYWSARRGRAPLAGIHLLKHGPTHRRTRLAPEEAARRLLAQVAWPTRSTEALARAFGLVGVIAERVPVWELEFAPRPDVAAEVFAEA